MDVRRAQNEPILTLGSMAVIPASRPYGQTCTEYAEQIRKVDLQQTTAERSEKSGLPKGPKSRFYFCGTEK